MSSRPVRDVLRFDYKVYDQTGNKVEKSLTETDQILEESSDNDMENISLIDEESKIYLEILRFWNEYDLDEIEYVDDIKESITELKILRKRFEDIHVEMKRAMGEKKHKETYENYEEDVKRMTEWVRMARKVISDRKKQENAALVTRQEEESIKTEKTRVKTEEKYLKIKINQLLSKTDLENAEDIDEIKESLFSLNKFLDKCTDLHREIEILYGEEVYRNEFEDDFKKITEDLSSEIKIGHQTIRSLRNKGKDSEGSGNAHAKRTYEERVSLSKHILEEIESRAQSLDELCSVSLKILDDIQILDKEKRVEKINFEFNVIMEKITELVKEIPSEYDKEDKVMENVYKIRDKLRITKSKYQLELENEVIDRDLSATKLQNASLLDIKLPKFKGYSSSIDIYTFQSEFEKLISPNIQKKLLPDYLKRNFLEGPALSLVKEIYDIDRIWDQLKESFGCALLLLQNKLSEVKRIGPLWKIKDKEKLITAISEMLNGMAELKKLAEFHNIKDQLYHHSYLGIIFDLMGNRRKEKFTYKNISSSINCEEKWSKLMEFLKHELKVTESLVLDEKSRCHQSKDDTIKNDKDVSNKLREKPSYVSSSTHSTSGIKCMICGKDDHVSVITKGGKKLVHYFSCEKFVKMKPSERFLELKSKNLCFQCLYPGAKSNHEGACFDQYTCKHSSHKKYSKSKHVLVCDDHKDDVKNKDLFQKYKMRFITKSNVEYRDFTKDMNLSFFSEAYPGKINEEKSESSIFMLQTIQIEGKNFNLFYDSGCGDLVSRKQAVDQLERMGRANNEVLGPIILTGVGDNKSVCQHGIYKVRLPLHDGRDVNISGLCLDKVTSEFPTYNLQQVQKDIHKAYQRNKMHKKTLPKLPNAVGGQTDLMIGIKYLKYFPKEIFQLPSGLTIYESAFANVDGSRGVIGGPHPVFTEIEKQSRGTHVSIESYCSKMLLLYQQGYKVSLDVPLLGSKRYEDVTSDEQSEGSSGVFLNKKIGLKSGLKLQKKFDEIENAGTDISYRCVKCRDCPNCKSNERVEHISIQEEVEQNLIDRSVTVELGKCQTIARLPFIKDPLHRLSTNEYIALKVYKSQLKRLGDCPEDKQEVIKSELKLQTLGFVEFLENLPDEKKRKIMESSIKHFIPWRAVWNLNSISTSCRLVFDASMKTNNDYSLNDMLAKGRNNMNKLVEVAIRWMVHTFAFHTDVQKMYNTIKLCEEHWCYQLYLWDNDLDPANEPKWKVIKTLIYGVVSSGNQAERGLRQTAELQKDQYPRENEIIQNDVYVDDCLSGENSLHAVQETTDNLKLMLNRGGFTLKGFTFSGFDPPTNLSDNGTSINVAGMRWYSKEDQISLNIGELNFGKKIRGKKPLIVEGLIPDEFTRRDCAGKVAEIFDLLGKMTPITAGMKLDLCELTKRKLDWDDKIPDELKAIWKDNFEMMKEINKIRFNRSIVPEDAVNLDIETIDTADSSRALMCAAIYSRFKRRNGEYSCQLVFSRSKVIPENMTMPRAELSAAVLNARTGHIVQRAFGKHFKKCIKLTDSQIVLHWITNNKLTLKQWVRNRIVEINRLTEPDTWMYTSSTNMVADLGTRKGAKLQDVSNESVWAKMG